MPRREHDLFSWEELENWDNWVFLREGHPIETKPVHEGKLRWIPSQMPQGLEVNLSNLEFYLKVLKFHGQLFLGNYVDDRSSRYSSSLPSSGGASVLTDFFGRDDVPKQQMVKQDHEDYQVFIDFGELKKKAEGNQEKFAELADQEFKKVLISIMWQEFFRIGTVELTVFMTALPFLILHLSKVALESHDKEFIDVVTDYLWQIMSWCYFSITFQNFLQKKVFTDQSMAEFLKALHIFPQFFLAEQPLLLRKIIKFSDLKNLGTAGFFLHLEKEIKEDKRRLIRSGEYFPEDDEEDEW